MDQYDREVVENIVEGVLSVFIGVCALMVVMKLTMDTWAELF